MVVGPVTSKVFYQFAGVRDLRRLGETSTTRPSGRKKLHQGPSHPPGPHSPNPLSPGLPPTRRERGGSKGFFD